MLVKAAVLNEVGADLAIEELALAAPREREVLVRVGAVGVCGSDLGTARGHGRSPLPIVLGHEAAGTVEAIGPGVTSVQPGQRVTLSWSPACGRCFYCQRGWPSQCELYMAAAGAGTLLDGTRRLARGSGEPVNHYACQSSFAEMAVVPESGCSPLPDGVPMPVAALVGCAVTTGFGAVVNDADVRPGDRVAVFGVGGVGLSALMSARYAGATTIACVDPNRAKAGVVERFGGDCLLDPRSDDVPARLRALTGGHGVDAVIECSGRPASFALAWQSLRPGGTLVVVGQAHAGESFELGNGRGLVQQQKRVVGSYYGGGLPERDFARVHAAYLAGRLDLDALVGETIALDQVNEALRAMERGVERRSVIVFPGARDSG